MPFLKFIAFLLSVGAHAALAVAFVADYQGTERQISFYDGEGDDQLLIDSSIVIEGVASLGTDIETVQAVDEDPQEAIEAAEVVEPVEEQEIDQVISAKAEPVDESEVLQEVVEPVKPEEVAQIAQAEQIVVEQKIASTGKQQGGDTTKRDRHFGKISTRIRKFVINPSTRQKGTAVVRFKVDPSGELLSREILKSSGSKRLDRAALKSIDRAAPFPPFPEGSITHAAVIKMKFNFSTR